jgi:hypothetical protein
MKLKSMGLLNWANLPNRDYEFSQINMITGESGAGKTTLLDALQTILTGTTAGLFQYNPGQEEATQQSRVKEVRTLASYVLGCDDASYARPHGAHGYLFANWVPEPGEKSRPFTALIGASAYLDVAGSKRTAKEEELVLAVVRSASLCVTDLLKTDDQGEDQIIPVNMLGPILNWRIPACSSRWPGARRITCVCCMAHCGARPASAAWKRAMPPGRSPDSWCTSR